MLKLQKTPRWLIVLAALVLLLLIAGFIANPVQQIQEEYLPEPTPEYIGPVSGEFKIPAGLDAYPGHTGIDIRIEAVPNAPVYAANAGTVVTAKESNVGYGNHIVIDHGDGIVSLYAHNSALLVQEGDIVEQGQNIARIGSTGSAYNEHMHFEMRKDGKIVDPVEFLPEPEAS